jgi:hypothetical protein
MVRNLLIFVLLIFNYKAFSQAIQGQVISDEDENPVAGVLISIKSKADSSTIAFGVSDPKGKFLIRYETDADTVLLQLRAMTIQPLSLLLSTTQKELQIKVLPSTLELEQVNVAGIKNPISQKRDTLSYDVGAFATQNDRVISDILKRIPGIEVLDNGMIRYEGRPLQKFYIDGLDLLEGRYNLANKAMPVDAVDRIEILENHQPIKVLDSLVFTDRASLNLKLKRKDVWIGTGYAGIGGAPFVHQLSLSPMYFSGNIQALNTIQSNNYGIDLKQQLHILTLENLLSNNHEPHYERWVEIQGIVPGIIPQSRYLFNNSQLGSFNFLKKNKKETEFRVNGSYIQQNFRENSTTETSLFFPDSEAIRLVEKQKNFFWQRDLSTELTWTGNLANQFFKNKTSVAIRSESGNSETLLDGLRTGQEVSLPYLHIGNHLQMIKPIRKTLYQVQSSTHYLRSNQQLVVDPSIFRLVSTSANESLILRQDIFSQRIISSNSIGTNRLLSSKLTIKQRLQVDIEHSQIESQVNVDVSGLQNENELQLGKINPGIIHGLQYNAEKLSLDVELPLYYLWLNIDEETAFAKRNLSRFYLQPYLYGKYLFSGKVFGTFTYRRSNEFGNLMNTYPGLLLRNYRTLTAFNTDIPESSGNQFIYALNFKDPLSALFFNLRLFHASLSRNTMQQNLVAGSGETVLSAIDFENRLQTRDYRLTGSKYITTLFTTLSFNTGYTQRLWPQLINGITTTTTFQSFSSGLDISIKPKKNFGVTLNTNQMQLNTLLDSKEVGEVTQWRTQAMLEYFPVTNHLMLLSGEFVNNMDQLGNRDKLGYLDLSYRLTFPKNKIDLELQGTNLLDTRIYNNIMTSSFMLISQQIQMRPRQVLLRVNFSF